MNFVTAAVRPLLVLGVVRSRNEIGGRARLRSSSSCSAACARASSRFEEVDLLLPAHRDEMHVAEVPGVVLLADAGGPGLRRRLGFEPGDELLRRPPRRGHDRP